MSQLVLNAIRTKYPILGIDPPAGLLAELAHVDGKLGDLAVLRHDPRDLAEAVATALVAGKDPATDKAVIEQLARRQIAESNLARLLPMIREQRQHKAITGYVDVLFADLAGVVTVAGKVIDEARRSIPGMSLDADHLGHVRPESLSLWGSARQAAEQVAAATDVWATVVTSTGLLPQIPANRRPLLVADLSYDDLVALEPDERPVRVADVVDAGHPVTLADAATFVERRDRVNREAQESAARAAAELATATRRAMASR